MASLSKDLTSVRVVGTKQIASPTMFQNRARREFNKKKKKVLESSMVELTI
ncbi:29748_t:CDS:2 [Gigaspora margarita]|uniref:29748_t:CDS:1 n=1 Tax=Gigaspora margarita TaxID=4874 RepID=A0ABN7UH01_GIGMA|nr:29748_t:CDS:2 [Gigaspora margarita]